MRVLLIDDGKEFRGGQRQAVWLARGLAARGVEVLVAARSGFPLDERLRAWDVPVWPLRLRFEGDPFEARRLASAIDRRGYDIINAQTSHAHTLGWMAAALAKSKPARVVTRRVDFVPRGAFSRYKYRRGADRYIAISRAIADILVGAGVERELVEVIHSAVEPMERVPGARDSVLTELGLPEGVRLIGDVAALVAHKSQADLIDAFALLARDEPAARLILVGEGPLRGELEERARARGVAPRVFFVGHRKDVARWHSAFDVFAMTSREEGLCTSILDAMTLGVPVAATAAGGIPDLVRDGETGRLAPVGDAPAIAGVLSLVLSRPEASAAMAETARRRAAAEFSVDGMVERTLALYRRLKG